MVKFKISLVFRKFISTFKNNWITLKQSLPCSEINGCVMCQIVITIYKLYFLDAAS